VKNMRKIDEINDIVLVISYLLIPVIEVVIRYAPQDEKFNSAVIEFFNVDKETLLTIGTFISILSIIALMNRIKHYFVCMAIVNVLLVLNLIIHFRYAYVYYYCYGMSW
jgi:hypothetical protein